MNRLLAKIKKKYSEYLEFTFSLEKELNPYLGDYFHGEMFSIFITEDEGGALVILSPLNEARYPLDEEHIQYIKKNKKLNEELGF